VGCPESRLPIAVLHQTGARHGDDVVLVRLQDWCDWFGPVTSADGPP